MAIATCPATRMRNSISSALNAFSFRHPRVKTPSVRLRLIKGRQQQDSMPSAKARSCSGPLSSVAVLNTSGLPVAKVLPITDPSIGRSRSSFTKPLLSGNSIVTERNWRCSRSGCHTETVSQCMHCRILAEIVRRRSRVTRLRPACSSGPGAASGARFRAADRHRAV